MLDVLFQKSVLKVVVSCIVASLPRATNIITSYMVRFFYFIAATSSVGAVLDFQSGTVQPVQFSTPEVQSVVPVVPGSWTFGDEIDLQGSRWFYISIFLTC